MGDALTQCPIQHSSSYPTRTVSAPGAGGHAVAVVAHCHAQSSFLRDTLYGAFIVRPPRSGNAYPFLAPHKEVPFRHSCSVTAAVLHSGRPRRSCKCDSSLSVDTKKNPMFLVSALSG